MICELIMVLNSINKYPKKVAYRELAELAQLPN